VRYRIVEEDRNSETLTVKSVDDTTGFYHAYVGKPPKLLVTDSGQVINWRYVRRLVPIGVADEPRVERSPVAECGAPGVGVTAGLTCDKPSGHRDARHGVNLPSGGYGSWVDVA
jgi:hypothetical protein